MIAVAAGIATGLALFVVVTVASYLGVRRPGDGRTVEVTWPAGADSGQGAELLAASGVVDRPGLFHALLWLTHPFVRPSPGPHLLTNDLTPAEVVRRLARLSSRQRSRLVVPEGFTRFQIAARLEELRVCSRRAFEVAAVDPAALRALAVPGDSVEGYLFPATYDFFADSAPERVLAELVQEAHRRLAGLRERHAEGFARLASKYGWSERDVVTLASIVEREAARAEEQPIIASVFYNRLDDPDFRPARSLQSDPTAAYGCLVDATLDSCRGYQGRVTPAMLRDAANPYNTYRHAGLPPGPIASPGVRAMESVLAPDATDYLFFVASGDGHHTFTRTLGEHEAAIRKGK